jgi:hypothetical protein
LSAPPMMNLEAKSCGNNRGSFLTSPMAPRGMNFTPRSELGPQG